MIRIDAIWLAAEPMDMRAGAETALAKLMRSSVRRNRTVLISLSTAARIE
jgi:hypothetical protein